MNKGSFICLALISGAWALWFTSELFFKPDTIRAGAQWLVAVAIVVQLYTLAYSIRKMRNG